MNQSLVVRGSLSDTGKHDIADAIAGAEAVVVADVSGSTVEFSADPNKSRHEVIQESLIDIQGRYPGKVAVIAFSDTPTFCPSGRLEKPTGGTNLAGALKFVGIAALAGLKIVVISDGLANAEKPCFDIVRNWTHGSLDTIYVGPETGLDSKGREFLAQLARAVGGHSSDIRLTTEKLTSTIILSLTGGNNGV